VLHGPQLQHFVSIVESLGCVLVARLGIFELRQSMHEGVGLLSVSQISGRSSGEGCVDWGVRAGGAVRVGGCHHDEEGLACILPLRPL
jgi:hypothetical protein